MSQCENHRQFLHGLVKGRVQGVFFRAETRSEAIRLGLSGWVRNTSDGHVEVMIGGEQAELEIIREWLLQGPPRARVDGLELVELDEEQARTRFGFCEKEFQIRR